MTDTPLARPGRRAFARWAVALGAAALAGCAGLPAAGPPPPPIVFVHGNGDSAALWMTTLWRFESNGWPRERLHAIDLPYPLARDADDQAQPGRTSTAEHRQFLAAEVDKVLARTGAAQVVLFGNSRGGNAIRSYIAGGGAAKVSHAILGGTPNHGVWSDPGFRPTNEFNGASSFLQALNNQGAPGVEVTPGPRWMTIRSDRNDKFAQPDGLWIGAAGRPTNVGFDSPELKGAQNVVIPGIDHRETSFSPQAFAAAYRFITGRDPAVTTPPLQPQVVLNGTVSGLGLGNDPARGAFVTNLPLAGATVEVYATDPATGERRGAPLLRRTTGPDGRWGPVSTDPRTPLEFVLSAPGYATSHIYRAPFARSSDVVHLRAERMADADRAAGAVVTLSRPRGYFGVPRDRFSLDGQSPAPGIAPGVAGLASSRLRLPAGPVRPVAGEFNGERIVGRTWPAAEGRLVTLEIH
jgi:pimeloyl-ACP methyl ester carboxylesterase